MAPEVIAKAFDPFFTTKEVGQGTGLLVIVAGLRFHQSESGGTRSKIYLQRQWYAGTPDPALISHLDIFPPTPPRKRSPLLRPLWQAKAWRPFSWLKMKLMCVALLSKCFAELGYRVIEAPDGPTGLRILDAHREINLLFTDVGLPGGMNGRQLAEQAQRRNAGLKVLFTSGYARNAIVHHGRLDPGVELLLKPFTFHGLAVKIRHVLDNQ